MTPELAKAENIVFSPNLRADEVLANYWMRQAMLRARREIAWAWHERGVNAPKSGELPPVVDKASDSLDLSRHWAEKRDFFANDTAAKYLTEQLAAEPPVVKDGRQGSFSWVVNELALDEVSSFALGLGLAAAFDASFGPVIATCLNDHARIYPNLMLIQRLWDIPESVLTLSDPMHPLFSFGLLRRSSAAARQYAETFWEQPLAVPSMVARELLSADNVKPAALSLLDPTEAEEGELDDTGKMLAYRLRAEKAKHLRVLPLLGNRRSAYRQTAVDIARIANRRLWEYHGDAALLSGEDYLNMLVTLCWLQDRDLFIKQELFDGEKTRERNEGLPLVSVPITLFVTITERRDLKHIEGELLLPVATIPALSYENRLVVWKNEFEDDAKKYRKILTEVSRRFRYEKETIRDIAAELK